MSIFADWEWMPPGGHQYLSFRLGNGSRTFDVIRDVVPSLAFACHHFGTPLPDGVIKKLKNRTQTEDTLFELLCLGMLSTRSKVTYEPSIASRKVPDLLIQPLDGPPVYVECKSHHMIESKYWRAFQTVSSQLCNELGDHPLVRTAWAKSMRTEVYLKGRPSEVEIRSAKQALTFVPLEALQESHEVSQNIAVKAVPRTESGPRSVSMHSGLITVGTEATQIGATNMHVVVYCWPRLDQQRRGVQRALLGEARLKLREIPAGSLGMICIQTVSANAFLPDVHELIDQKQFDRIPIIWINPALGAGANSRVIFRDEARRLVGQLI